jgi:hypothetical protein
MVSTVTIGYTLLLHIQLYHIYPVLVIVPLLFIGVVVHFVTKAMNSKTEVDKALFLETVRKRQRSRKSTNLQSSRKESEPYSPGKADQKYLVVTRDGRSAKHITRRESVALGLKVTQKLEEGLKVSNTGSNMKHRSRLLYLREGVAEDEELELESYELTSFDEEVSLESDSYSSDTLTQPQRQHGLPVIQVHPSGGGVLLGIHNSVASLESMSSMDSVEAGDILIQPNGSASSDESKESVLDEIEEDDGDEEGEDDFEARANSAILARQFAKNKALAEMHAQRHARLRSPPPPLPPSASQSSSRSTSSSRNDISSSPSQYCSPNATGALLIDGCSILNRSVSLE